MTPSKITSIDMKSIKIPKGQVFAISSVLNYIQSKFNTVEIKIKASDGSIRKGKYEDNIIEALKQMVLI